MGDDFCEKKLTRLMFILATFLQLFGSRNADADAAPESEDEDEDENDADENADKAIIMKKGFDCKLCDFQARVPKRFKASNVHVYVYFCDLCPKWFGVLKSWRVHIETVHHRRGTAKGDQSKGGQAQGAAY